MLDYEHAAQRLADLLAACQCEVELPPEDHGFFDETGEVPSVLEERRRFRRVRLRTSIAIQPQQTLPGLPRSAAWQKVYAKDISRCGMAFLHSEQLFPHERVRVLLPNGSQRSIQIERCRRLNRRCFEIGARFLGQSSPAD